MEHTFLMFLDHTQRRSTVGRTPGRVINSSQRPLYIYIYDISRLRVKFLRNWNILISHIWVAFFYWGDAIKEGAKDNVCRTHGEGEDSCRIYVRKPEWKRPLWRTRSRWQNNLKNVLSKLKGFQLHSSAYSEHALNLRVLENGWNSWLS